MKKSFLLKMSPLPQKKKNRHPLPLAQDTETERHAQRYAQRADVHQNGSCGHSWLAGFLLIDFLTLCCSVLLDLWLFFTASIYDLSSTQEKIK